jgi:hypothetical protein
VSWRWHWCWLDCTNIPCHQQNLEKGFYLELHENMKKLFKFHLCQFRFQEFLIWKFSNQILQLQSECKH